MNQTELEQKRNFCKKKYGNSQKKLHACLRRIKPRKKRCEDAKVRYNMPDGRKGGIDLCKDAMKHEDSDKNEPIIT